METELISEFQEKYKGKIILFNSDVHYLFVKGTLKDMTEKGLYMENAEVLKYGIFSMLPNTFLNGDLEKILNHPNMRHVGDVRYPYSIINTQYPIYTLGEKSRYCCKDNNIGLHSLWLTT